jgi:hypothetical protein
MDCHIVVAMLGSKFAADFPFFQRHKLSVPNALPAVVFVLISNIFIRLVLALNTPPTQPTSHSRRQSSTHINTTTSITLYPLCDLFVHFLDSTVFLRSPAISIRAIHRSFVEITVLFEIPSFPLVETFCYFGSTSFPSKTSFS